MEKLLIFNWKRFNKSNVTYSDFVSRLNSLLNAVAPARKVTVKITQVNGLMEISQGKFTNKKDHVKDLNQQNFMFTMKNTARHNMQSPIYFDKKTFCEEKLKATTENPEKNPETSCC